MTKRNETEMAREHNTEVPFAHVGGIMARRRISLRRMEALIDVPYSTIRTWLQGGITRPKRARRIQEDVEEKLGITITNSPYEGKS